jgi:hypothetical protein
MFSLTASSQTTLSYQWYQISNLFEQVLANQTGSSLVFTNASSAVVGTYYVKVSNAGGTVSSTHASLTLVTVPIANNDIYSTMKNLTLTIPVSGVLSNDLDTNGHPLIALLVTNVASGSLVFNTNGSFTYIPQTNFTGTDVFNYVAVDGSTTLLEQNTGTAQNLELKNGETCSQSFMHGTVGNYQSDDKKSRCGISKLQ